MLLIGYARVSTTEQNLDLQTDARQAAGCARLFTDTVSGAKVDRLGLTAALTACRSGDTLVVWQLNRLGRSLRSRKSLAYCSRILGTASVRSA